MDAWYLYRHAGEIYTHTMAATAGAGVARYALTGNPATLRYAGKMASFAIRAHANAVRGVLGTRLTMGSARTVGGALARGAGAVTAGYALGAAVGTGITAAAFGNDAAMDLAGLYSRPADFWDEALSPGAFAGNLSSVVSHYNPF